MKRIIILFLFLTACSSLMDISINYHNKGVEELKAENYRAAYEYFTSAIETTEGLPDTYYNRAICKFNLGDLEGALLDFDYYLDHSGYRPVSEEYAHLYKGVIYEKLKMYKDALDEYKEAVYYMHKYGTALYHSGELKSFLGNYKDAINDYNKALLLTPYDYKNEEVYLGLGDAHFNSGDYNSAISDYSKVIELNSKSAAAYKSRGDALNLSGNKEKAALDWKKARELGWTDFIKDLNN